MADPEGAHLTAASSPDLIRGSDIAARLGPRVKPADDGVAGAKLDRARSPPAGEDARGPHFRSVIPATAGIHDRPEAQCFPLESPPPHSRTPKAIRDPALQHGS